MKRSDWPEINERVVVKIKRIDNFGAVAELIEYPGKDVFIHVSQVASSWIKNIRSFISEGQQRVAEIVKIDESKGTIDASLKKVSKQEEKRKMNEWKREKRADKLFERACSELKEKPEECFEKIAFLLEDEFGDLLSSFEAASLEGEATFSDINIPEKWKKEITKIAKENVTIKSVTSKCKLTIKIGTGDGIDIIKKALKAAQIDDNINIHYVSAPIYTITATAHDYGESESLLSRSVQKAIEVLRSHGGEAEFEKIKA